MMEGSKRCVMWPYEEKSKLYETKLTTEDNDEVLNVHSFFCRVLFFSNVYKTMTNQLNLFFSIHNLS
jgi:hypothetical protein